MSSKNVFPPISVLENWNFYEFKVKSWIIGIWRHVLISYQLERKNKIKSKNNKNQNERKNNCPPGKVLAPPFGCISRSKTDRRKLTSYLDTAPQV